MYLLRANIFHTAHLNIVTATNQTTDAHNIYSLAFCETSLIGQSQWRTEGGVLGGSNPPSPKFRRYRWSPRSHEQEEPAS